MKTTLGLLCLCLLTLCAAAGPRNPRPDWTEGQSMEYPRERYIVGVGLADDRASAEDRARGEIARVFSSLVTVNTSLLESESNEKNGKAEKSNFSQSVSQNVQTASKKLLEGVEVVENWQDEATRQHYALAVLERSKGIVMLTDKIKDFDKQAQEWKSQLEQSTERLPKVRAGMKLLAVLKARAELNSELRVLDAGGKGIPSLIDEAQVRPAAAKAISELEVYVDVTGGSGDQVETAVVKGLNSFGLQAANIKSSGVPDIIVEGKVSTKAMDSGDDKRWKWARSSATVSLKDGRTNKIFLRFDASDRQASSDFAEAERRTLAALAKKVSPQIDEAITRYFENQ